MGLTGGVSSGREGTGQLPEATTTTSLSRIVLSVVTRAGDVPAFETKHGRRGHAHTASARSFGERLGQGQRGNETMHGNQKAGRHVSGERRLQSSRRASIEQRALHARGGERAGITGQRRCLGLVERHLQCSIPLVLNRAARVALDATNEVVVHGEAARGEIAKRGNMAFDLWSEDARGRSCGTTADAT